MDEKTPASAQRIEHLVRRLPRDIGPETDLWPRIVARIDAAQDSRFRQLPRDVEPASDLWPAIRSRLGAREPGFGTDRRWRLPGTYLSSTRVAATAGVVTMVVMAALVTLQLRDIATTVIDAAPDPTPESSIATAAPAAADWMAGMLARFGNAEDGTRAAPVGEAARAIERDFLMVQAERLRIEQALAASDDDANLRAQWSRVYRTELQLIDEAQRLGTLYATRSAI